MISKLIKNNISIRIISIFITISFSLTSTGMTSVYAEGINLSPQSAISPLTNPQIKDIAMLEYFLVSHIISKDINILEYKNDISTDSGDIEYWGDEAKISFRFSASRSDMNGTVSLIPCSFNEKKYMCAVRRKGISASLSLPYDIVIYSEKEIGWRDAEEEILSLRKEQRRERQAIERAVASERKHDEKIRRAVLNGRFERITEDNSKIMLNIIYCFLAHISADLMRDFRALTERGQVMMITEDREGLRLEEPHAGGRGIYLPYNVPAEEIAGTLIHETFAKAGFTHEECTVFQGLFKRYLKYVTDDTMDPAGMPPEELSLTEDEKRLLGEAKHADFIEFYSEDTPIEVIEKRDYSAEEDDEILSAPGVPMIKSEFPNDDPTILVMGPYMDKLGEDLVLFRIIVKRLLATFPNAKIKIAIDYPAIFELDESVKGQVEILRPFVETSQGNKPARSEMAGKGPISGFWLADAGETIKNAKADVIVNLMHSGIGDVMVRGMVSKIMKKNYGLRAPYLIYGMRATEYPAMMAKGEALVVKFHDRSGKLYKLPPVHSKNVYDALERVCDTIGLERTDDYTIDVAPEKIKQAKEFIKEELNKKGQDYDPSKPVVLLNMFAIASFFDTVAFMEEWRNIIYRLAKINSAYIVVSQGDKTTARELQREMDLYKKRGGGDLLDYPNMRLIDMANKLCRLSSNAVLLPLPAPHDPAGQEEVLKKFIAVTAVSDIVITPDTGTMHLAYFLGKPTVPVAFREKDTWFPPEIYKTRHEKLVGIDEQQAYLDFVEIFNDLSILVQTEKFKRYSAVSEQIGRSINESTTIDELAVRVLSILENAIDFDYAVIGGFYGENAKILASSGFSSSAKDIIIKYKLQSEQKSLLRDGESIHENMELKKDDLFLDSLEMVRKHEIGEVYLAPLAAKGEPFSGFLQIAYKKGKVMPEKDRNLIEAIRTLLTGGMRKILSEERITKLYDEAPVAFHNVDLRGGITQVNKNWSKIMGYAEDEVIGRPIFDFIIPEQQASARERFFARLSGITENGLPERDEYRIYKTKDGRVIIGETHNTFIRNILGEIIGVETSFMDVTEQRNAEDKIRSFLEELPAAVFYKEVDGEDIRFKYVNTRFYEFMGLDPEKAGIEGMTEFEIRDKFDMGPLYRAEKYTEDDWRVLRGEETVYTEEVNTYGGGKIHVQVGKRKLGNGILGTFTDITKLHKVMKDLEQAKKEADEANRAKSLILSAITHDMRTPFNGILGMLEILKEHFEAKGVWDEEARQYFSMINFSGGKLISMIGDILDFSRIEEVGEVELKKEEVEIEKLLRDISGVTSMLAKDKEKEFKSILDDSVSSDICIIGDEERIGRIVNNLLSNAIKFTPAGGTITLAAGIDNGILEISVQDTGIGIPPEEQDIIFERFGQAKGGRGQGTGLGLYTARNLARQMGGDLTIRSIEGEGSMFILRIPVQVRSKVTRKVTSLADLRVLVAENDEDSQFLFKAILKSWGIKNSKYVSDGIDLIEELLKAEEEGVIPDVILLDLSMPKINGWEFLEMLSKDERLAPFREVPVIIHTAHSDSEARKAVAKGARSYIRKPFDMQKFKGALEDIVKDAPERHDHETPEKIRQDKAKKNVEAAIAESEEGIKEMFDNSSVGIAFFDHSGKIIEANKACLDIIGASDISEIERGSLFLRGEDPVTTRKEISSGKAVRIETNIAGQKVICHTTRFADPYSSALGYLVQVQRLDEYEQLKAREAEIKARLVELGKLSKLEKAFMLQTAPADKIALVYGSNYQEGVKALGASGFKGEIIIARDRHELELYFKDSNMQFDVLIDASPDNSLEKVLREIFSALEARPPVVIDAADTQFQEKLITEVCA